jgi:hypothetical protein
MITDENIELTDINVIYGIIDEVEENETLNACILIAKWYIYKCRLDEKSIFFYSFLCDLKYFLIIEKTIALRTNNYLKYTEMWLTIEDNMT